MVKKRIKRMLELNDIEEEEQEQEQPEYLGSSLSKKRENLPNPPIVTSRKHLLIPNFKKKNDQNRIDINKNNIRLIL